MTLSNMGFHPTKAYVMSKYMKYTPYACMNASQPFSQGELVGLQ